MTRPVAAIIGRQNVGKSTLLNRFAGKQLAIVEDLPGTTRDRLYTTVSWQNREFTLVDTGGLELNPDTPISKGINEQINTAIEDADIVLFMVDVRDGVTPADLDIAAMLRRSNKPVIVIANKADNNKLESHAVEFFELGMEAPMVISAHHGRGTAEVLDKIVELLPAPEEGPSGEDSMKLALVGRPNVGKSAILNALIGEQRVIVDNTPGTTRDAIDTFLDYQGQNVLLIDTAGIKRRGRQGTGVDKYSVIRSLRAIDRADIALLVVDASEPFTAQDVHIAGYIREMAKGIVLIVNKWDLVSDKNKVEWNNLIRSQLNFMPYAPVLYTSAKDGQGIGKIMPQAYQVYQERLKRLSTATVNNAVQQAIASHNLPRVGSKRLKILYATQAEVNPPTFVFFVNDKKLIHFSYQRYLENRLRETFGFAGTPLRMIFKSRGEE
jgi:GTP-binding protein